jgi:putative heme-binding domain-containing protein
MTLRGAAMAMIALIVAAIGVRASSGDWPLPQKPAPASVDPSQPFSKEWKMDDLLPVVKDLGTGRDWAQGRDLFKKAACGGCHAFGTESEGTGLAPDLTSVGSTYSRDFILQSILEPSATVNGRFFQTRFTLKDGKTVTGSVVDVIDKKIIVAPIMLAPQVTIEIPQGDIKAEEPSPVSAMPPGLLNQFTKEQIVELMAYLDSGGDRNAAVYKKKSP